MSRPRPLQELLSVYLDWCFTREEQPRVKEFAQFVNVDRVTLYRWCMREYETPPNRMLREPRLARAAELLQSGTANAAAYGAGFGNRRNLFREFRRHRKTTPRGRKR